LKKYIFINIYDRKYFLHLNNALDFPTASRAFGNEVIFSGDSCNVLVNPLQTLRGVHGRVFLTTFGRLNYLKSNIGENSEKKLLLAKY